MPYLFQTSHANVDDRGRLVQDKATKRSRLGVRNWEIGIVTPVEPTWGGFGFSDNKNQDLEGSQDIAAFSTAVPLPVKLPADEYDLSSRKPWFFNR